jgi:hypothetical protein
MSDRLSRAQDDAGPVPAVGRQRTGAILGKGIHVLSRRSKLRIGSTAVIGAAALFLSAASANAGLLAPPAASCDAQPLSTPFEPWMDIAKYTPLAGGSFESSLAGWTLAGGAQVAAGNESFHVSGPGSSSLSVPAGGSATSPAICVGVEHPAMRFFAKTDGAGLLGVSLMRVDVLFQNNLGLVSSLPIGLVAGSATWQPTLPMTILANLLAVYPGDKTAVAFRFTPLLGDVSIDDVEVDPYQRH